MSAGSVCVREVHLVTSDESAVDAARRMEERNVGTLVVLDAERRPVGIVTDRDLAVRVLGHGRPPDRTRVGEVMTSPVKSVYEDTPLEDALRTLREGGFRRLCVLDREDRLAGMLAIDDVVQVLADDLDRIAALMRRQEPTSV